MHQNQVGQNWHLIWRNRFKNKGNHWRRCQIYSSWYCTKNRHITINGSPYFKKHLKVPKMLLDRSHICWLMSKTNNGLKWPKSCFKCFKLMTKNSLPMSLRWWKLVYYFEPVRNVSNKMWATKHSRRPIIVKLSLSARKVWYAIFFSDEGVAIRVLVEKGKNITGKYYKDVVLEKQKKHYQKRCPVTGFKHIGLLHDKVPAHTSVIVRAFLKRKK